MANEGYLIGYEDNNGDFVQIGQFNNSADDVTEPIEIVHTDSGEKIQIDGSGVKPSTLTGVTNVADRQGCRVFLSSDQSITQDSTEKIQFDGVEYDSGNNFSTSSHFWTCPEDGLYMVNLQINFRSGGSGEIRNAFIGSATDFTPSGQGAFKQKSSSNRDDTLSVSTVNKYSQGDTIAAYARNGGNSDNLNSGNFSFKSFLEVAFIGVL